MAKNSLVFLDIQITGDEINPVNIVPVFTNNTNSPNESLLVSLTSGTTNIAIPSGATQALLVPLASTTAVTKTLAATAISPNQPTLLSLSTTSTTLSITASGTETLNVYFF
jgi:hypothetical protein